MKSPILDYLLIALAVVLTISSLGGVLFPEMYAAETGDWAAQSIAQDFFDLIVGVPALLLTYYFVRRGSRLAFFMLSGFLVFLIYTFIIYTLAVHFNQFFLLYCFTLALATYSLIILWWQIGAETVKTWFDTSSAPVAPIIYLLFFTLLFYTLWLLDIVPALVDGVVPASLIQTGLLTNPVHVIDLSFLLPGFAITAMLLGKHHALAYMLAPTIMAFSIFMTLSIATLIVFEYMQGFISNFSVAFGMIFFSIVSVAILLSFLKRMKSRHGYTYKIAR